jgi:hypothetical protein
MKMREEVDIGKIPFEQQQKDDCRVCSEFIHQFKSLTNIEI